MGLLGEADYGYGPEYGPEGGYGHEGGYGYEDYGGHGAHVALRQQLIPLGVLFGAQIYMFETRVLVLYPKFDEH
jgi:hypothetical protein